ncbi:hypothetical protein JXB41_05275 [Candidatus Woesearchaeota archaeon]|nr:hypothetical protein [Candidatus Woesearchaeota archaeon]
MVREAKAGLDRVTDAVMNMVYCGNQYPKEGSGIYYWKAFKRQMSNLKSPYSDFATQDPFFSIEPATHSKNKDVFEVQILCDSDFKEDRIILKRESSFETRVNNYVRDIIRLLPENTFHFKLPEELFRIEGYFDVFREPGTFVAYESVSPLARDVTDSMDGILPSLHRLVEVLAEMHFLMCAFPQDEGVIDAFGMNTLVEGLMQKIEDRFPRYLGFGGSQTGILREILPNIIGVYTEGGEFSPFSSTVSAPVLETDMSVSNSRLTPDDVYKIDFGTVWKTFPWYIFNKTITLAACSNDCTTILDNLRSLCDRYAERYNFLVSNYGQRLIEYSQRRSHPTELDVHAMEEIPSADGLYFALLHSLSIAPIILYHDEHYLTDPNDSRRRSERTRKGKGIIIDDAYRDRILHVGEMACEQLIGEYMFLDSQLLGYNGTIPFPLYRLEQCARIDALGEIYRRNIRKQAEAHSTALELDAYQAGYTHLFSPTNVSTSSTVAAY